MAKTNKRLSRDDFDFDLSTVWKNSELMQGRGSREDRWESGKALAAESAFIRFCRHAYPVLATVLCILLSLALILTVCGLPAFGREDAPTNNEVAQTYITDAISETGAVNAVAGMIIYFRGFDTLGESHVLFAAVCAVMILLMTQPDSALLKAEQEEERLYDVTLDPILRTVAGILTPVIMLFGIYIILNGHLSTGGGFSGGTVIGSALIFHSVACGFDETERYLNSRVYDIIRVCALLLYSTLMVYFFYTGANELDAWIPRGTAGNIFSAGFILPINFAVGAVVACTMYGLFSLFRRGRI